MGGSGMGVTDSPGWTADRLLPGYEQLVLPLPDAAPAPGEPEGVELFATLVRRNAPTGRRALLYVHGWNDYFFQTHLADIVDQMGFDFYALDLRRFGRSLRDEHVPGFIDDLDQYRQELDAAAEVIHRDHPSLTVMAHSTGGLACSLWAGERPGVIDGMVLNSPWLAQHGNALVAAAARPVVNLLGGRYPTGVIPVANNGLYARSIESVDGEWAIDERVKNTTSFKLRVGWFSAILEGHRRVAQGLGIQVPVLTLVSARSLFGNSWDEAMRSADTVLDVETISEAAVHLGRHVTVVRVDGGLHDLALSAPEVRGVYFDEIARWVHAYLD